MNVDYILCISSSKIYKTRDNFAIFQSNIYIDKKMGELESARSIAVVDAINNIYI